MLLLHSVAVVLLGLWPGLAVLTLWPADHRERLGAWWWALAPAAGLSVVAMLVYAMVLLENGLTWHAAVVPLMLAVVGVVHAVRLPGRTALSALALTMVGTAITVGITGFPFRNHLVPPGVDAQLFGLLASLLKRNGGFPLTQFHGAWDATYLFAASAGSEAFVAGYSEVTGWPLGVTLVTVAVAWVSAALLAAAVFVRTLIGHRSAWLVLAVLPFGMSAAFVWEYGDGSYARAAAAAPTMVLLALMAQVHRPSRASSIVLGVIHAATAFLLYRVFLWNSLAIAVWAGVLMWRHQSDLKRVVLDVGAAMAACVICLLPMLLAVVARLDLYAGVHGAGTPLFAEKHALTWTQLIRYGEYVHGWLGPSVVVLGCVVAAVGMVLTRLRLDGGAIRAGMAFTVAMAFFANDRLVLTLLPFTTNLLYSQMAIIANWSPTKLLGGVAVACLVNDLAVNGGVMARLGLVAAGGAAWYWLGPEIQVSAVAAWPAFRESWPSMDSGGTEFIYSWATWGIAAVCGVGALLLSFERRGATWLVLCGLFLVAASEFRVARFNYAYLSSDEHEAYVWLREQTPPRGTLVLTASTMELD